MGRAECRAVKRSVFVVVALLLSPCWGWCGEKGVGGRVADPTPGQGVVLDPCVGWRVSTAWTLGKHTENFAHDFSGGRARFTVGEAKKCMVWTRKLRLPIRAERYPLFSVKYRASNPGREGWHYVMWMDDGTGPRGGGLHVASPNDLVADGKAHDIRRDLRNLRPRGPIKLIVLAVYCEKNPPTAFELLDLRFMAPPGAPARRVAPDTPLRVLVKATKGYRPIPGATVTVDFERRNFARRGVTGEDGLVTITPLKNSWARHTFLVEKEGMYPARTTGLRFWKRSRHELYLYRAARYGGFFKDEAGAPIEGATIGLSWKWYRFRKIARTDARGRWRSPPFLADVPRLSVRTWHPDYLCPKAWRKMDEDAMKALRAGTHVTVLGHGVTVSGRVLDDQGWPTPNPKVKAMLAVSVSGRVFAAKVSAETDETGTYRLDRVPRGTYRLMAFGDKHAPSVKEVRVEGKPLTVDLTIGPGRAFKGKVVDLRGQPLGGVEVCVSYWKSRFGERPPDSYYATYWKAAAGEDGRFEWRGAPWDPIRVSFTKAGYRRHLGWFRPKDGDVVFTLLKPLKIRGTVTDAETGKPVKSFKVIQAQVPDTGKVHWVRRYDLDANGVNGKYTANIGLSGDVAVRVLADGYLPADSPPFKKAEGERRFDVALKKKGSR